MPMLVTATLAVWVFLLWYLGWVRSYRWPWTADEKFAVAAIVTVIVVAVAMRGTTESIRFSANACVGSGIFICAAAIPWRAAGALVSALHGATTALVFVVFVHVACLRFEPTRKFGQPIVVGGIAALLIVILVSGLPQVSLALAAVVVIVWLGLARSTSVFGGVAGLYALCVLGSIFDSTQTIRHLRRLGDLPADAVDQGMVALHRGLMHDAPVLAMVQVFALATLFGRGFISRRRNAEIAPQALLFIGLCVLIFRTR